MEKMLSLWRDMIVQWSHFVKMQVTDLLDEVHALGRLDAVGVVHNMGDVIF